MNDRTTTDGQPADPAMAGKGAPKPIDPATGQHGAYYILSDAERAKGFVRPVRDKYVHVGPGGTEQARTGRGCGALTRMGRDIAETYARYPAFYSATFCIGCKAHLPVAEFVWDHEGGGVVGS